MQKWNPVGRMLISPEGLQVISARFTLAIRELIHSRLVNPGLSTAVKLIPSSSSLTKRETNRRNSIVRKTWKLVARRQDPLCCAFSRAGSGSGRMDVFFFEQMDGCLGLGSLRPAC